MTKTFDWEDVWSGILATAVVLAAMFGGFAIAKEHRVDGYYLSNSANARAAVCVYAHWTWHNDELVFCTDDKDKALDFTAKANALVK